MNGIGFDKRMVRSQDDARLREKIFSDGRLAGCALTYTGKNLTIGIGHMVVKGRILAFDAAETVASDTTEAAGYGRLKLVIDLTQTASETEFAQYAWDWDYAATNSFPALTQDDINDGTHTEYEMIICIVQFSSSNIASITSDMAQAVVGAGLLWDGLSLPTTGYSGAGPYTKAFTVTGALTDTTKRYTLFPDWSSTAATRALEKTAWNLVDDYDITEANTLTITVTAVPATAVPFSLKEVV